MTAQVLKSPVSKLPPEDQAAALGALQAARDGRARGDGPAPESPDWREYVKIVGVLKRFGALDDEHRVTELGGLVAAVKGDNELLLALALLDEATLAVAERGSAGEFAALCSAFVSEVGSRPGVFVDYGPSPSVAAAVGAGAGINMIGPEVASVSTLRTSEYPRRAPRGVAATVPRTVKLAPRGVAATLGAS